MSKRKLLTMVCAAVAVFFYGCTTGKPANPNHDSQPTASKSDAEEGDLRLKDGADVNAKGKEGVSVFAFAVVQSTDLLDGVPPLCFTNMGKLAKLLNKSMMKWPNCCGSMAVNNAQDRVNNLRRRYG